jgi:Tfp pilus assembly protein PilX
MRKRKFRNQERGMALLTALLALLLVSAIGMGMMYMSTTETAINANYRDTQQAFFAMRAGLEEMRDRMRINAVSPLTVPTVMPATAAAGSIVYITNPSASETVDPTSPTSTYFDDEFCHETFTGVSYTGVTTGVPCAGTAQAPPSAAVTTVASVAPFTGTSSSLKYKWVRITLKQNGTFPSALVAPIDATHPANSQICWNTATSNEVVLSSLPSGPYTDCLDAKSKGQQVGPVYIITALAYTPQGSRRIGQYESASVSITPPPAALALDGPGVPNPIFSPIPNSNNYAVNGNDGSGTPPTPPAPACPSSSAVVPAIGASATGVTQIDLNIPTNRQGNYTGTPPPSPAASTPSVVDETAQLTGLYANPATLNSLVATLANSADVSINCGIGTPCSGSPPYGTNANPQITYVNGDLSAGATTGAGVLVVTGSLLISGHFSFNGLILVIGQGIMTVSGGGDGTIYGQLFIANTNSQTSPYAQLAAVGQPTLSWNGGGKAAIYYNSCWADRLNLMHYIVVASREEMY